MNHRRIICQIKKNANVADASKRLVAVTVAVVSKNRCPACDCDPCDCGWGSCTADQERRSSGI